MIRAAIFPMRVLIAVGVGAAALMWSGEIPTNGPRSLISIAEARIGRPMTPMSYAGVARRTTRRTVAVGAAAGAAAYGAYGASGCSQVVNSYGQVTTVCQ